MDFIDNITPASEIVGTKSPVERRLSGEWRCRILQEERIYFVNVETKKSQWLPPPELWNSKFGLPYGWEVGVDHQNVRYYINHVNRTTTREDPRSEADQATHLHSMTPPRARKVQIVRDEIIGYGFVAGSEKPVVIRSVIPNGPSHEILFANDQIMKVNGDDVRDAPQTDVINLIKLCAGPLNMEVVAIEDLQDVKNKHHRKSSLMSRTTRERRKSSPVNVRFADNQTLVHYIGPEEQVRRSSVPLMPNVLKVFLENGQTRSFRYTNDTLVEEILSSLAEKLAIEVTENFGLVLGGPHTGQVCYVNNHEKVSEIYCSRNCSSVNWLCKLQICFVPKKPYELLKKDPNAFEYLYAQVSNNVVDGLYGVDLRFDTAIKLAALHIQQVATEDAEGKTVKISVKNIDKDYGGLHRFIPGDVLNINKEKRLRKAVSQQIKQNLTLAAPGQKHMNALQCKWHYLNIASEIYSYGGKYFNVLLVSGKDKQEDLEKQIKQEATLLVGPTYGISHVVNAKIHVCCELAKFELMTGITVLHHIEGKRQLNVGLTEGKEVTVIVSAMDCLDIIALVSGYYQLYIGSTLPVKGDGILQIPLDVLNSPCDEAPLYRSNHRVLPDSWSYPIYYMSEEEQQFKKWLSSPDGVYKKLANEDFRIDFSKEPPPADMDYSSDALNIFEPGSASKTGATSLSARAQQYLVNQSMGRLNAKRDSSVFDEDDASPKQLAREAYGVGTEQLTSPTLSQSSSLYEIPEEDGWTHVGEGGTANEEDENGNGNRNTILNLLMAEHQWMNKVMESIGDRTNKKAELEENENRVVRGREDGSRMAARRAKLHLDLPSAASSFPDRFASEANGDDESVFDLDIHSQLKRSGTLSRYLVPSSQGGLDTPDAATSEDGVEQDLGDTQSINSMSESINSSDMRDDMAKDRIGAVRLRALSDASAVEDSASTWSWSSDEQEGDEVFVIHQDELPCEDDSMLPEIFLQPSMSFSRYSRNLSNLATPQPPAIIGSMMSLAQFETDSVETDKTSAENNSGESHNDQQNTVVDGGNDLRDTYVGENNKVNKKSSSAGTVSDVSVDGECDITIEQIRRLRDKKRILSSGGSQSESLADESSYMELILGEARLAQIHRRRRTRDDDENSDLLPESEVDNRFEVTHQLRDTEIESQEKSAVLENSRNATPNEQLSEQALIAALNDETDGTSDNIVTKTENSTDQQPEAPSEDTEDIPYVDSSAENTNKYPSFDAYLASRFSPSQWIVPQPPSETEELADLHVVSPPPSEFQEMKFDEPISPKLEEFSSESGVNTIDATLFCLQHGQDYLPESVELGSNLGDKEIEELIVPPPPTVTDPLIRVLIASPPSAFLDAPDAFQEPGFSTNTVKSSKSVTGDNTTVDLSSESAISRELQRVKTLSLGGVVEESTDTDMNNQDSVQPKDNEKRVTFSKPSLITDTTRDKQRSSTSSTSSETEIFHGSSSPAIRSRKPKPSPPERKSSLGFPKEIDSCPEEANVAEVVDAYMFHSPSNEVNSTLQSVDSMSFDNSSSHEISTIINQDKSHDASTVCVTADKKRCCYIANTAVTSATEMKDQLEKFLNETGKVRSRLDQDSEIQDNWPQSMQNNARFLACDVKVISSAIQNNKGEIVPALETSLASLRKLVSSCEVLISRNPKLEYNVETLVSMTISIVTLYSDVIVCTKAAIEKPIDKQHKELVTDKAEALVNHLVSLITALRTFQQTQFSEV